jgi:hypothetical protein
MRGAWPNNCKKDMLMGGMAALLICLLMGAVKNDGPALPMAVLDSGADRVMPLSNTGRYQIATWEAGGGYGAFVVDTSTGTTKVAYSSIKGPTGKSVDNLGKSFDKM